MFACQSPEAVINKKEGLQSLTKLMEELNTAPALKPMITGIIRHVQKGAAPTNRSFDFANFGGNLTRRNIFRGQAEIGWTNFLCGRWGVTWRQAQQTHYLKTKSRKSVRLWAIAVLKKLFLVKMGYVAVS